MVAPDAPSDALENNEPTSVPVLIVPDILASPETSNATVGAVL